MNTEYLDFVQKANARKQYLNDLLLTDTNPENIQRYRKEIRDLDEEIRTINGGSSLNPAALQGKIKIYRSWLIVLGLLVVALILGAVALFVISNGDASDYREKYNKASELNDDYESKQKELQTEKDNLQSENRNLSSKVSSLETENKNLSSRVSTLETENAEIRGEANWFHTRCKIVIADTGSLYKTYHTYDCDKWAGHRYWVYNNEQVVGKSGFTRCPDCN